MENLCFKGEACHTCGEVPSVGSKAPSFTLTGKDLNDVCCCDFKGKRIVLNVFPSLDTPVCAASVRRFNKEASGLDDTVVVCVSMDLPFAMSRFCTTEGLEDVVVASAFRSPEFLKDYGLQIADGPLRGLLARCVLVLDRERTVIYRELVGEISSEPDYQTALDALKNV